MKHVHQMVWWHYLLALLLATAVSIGVAALAGAFKSTSTATVTPVATAAANGGGGAAAAASETADEGGQQEGGDAEPAVEARYNCDQLTPFTKLPSVEVPTASGYEVWTNASGNACVISAGGSPYCSFISRGVAPDGDPNTWTEPVYDTSSGSSRARISYDGQFALMGTSGLLIKSMRRFNGTVAETEFSMNDADSGVTFSRNGMQFFNFIGESNDIAACNIVGKHLSIFHKADGANTWSKAQDMGALPTGNGQFIHNPQGGGNALAVSYQHSDTSTHVRVYHANEGGSYVQTQDITLPSGTYNYGGRENYHLLSLSGQTLVTMDEHNIVGVYARDADTNQFVETPNANAEVTTKLNCASARIYQDTMFAAQGWHDGGSGEGPNVIVVNLTSDRRAVELPERKLQVGFDMGITYSLWRFALARAPVANTVALVVSRAANTVIDDYRSSCVQV